MRAAPWRHSQSLCTPLHIICAISLQDPFRCATAPAAYDAFKRVTRQAGPVWIAADCLWQAVGACARQQHRAGPPPRQQQQAGGKRARGAAAGEGDGYYDYFGYGYGAEWAEEGERRRKQQEERRQKEQRKHEQQSSARGDAAAAAAAAAARDRSRSTEELSAEVPLEMPIRELQAFVKEHVSTVSAVWLHTFTGVPSSSQAACLIIFCAWGQGPEPVGKVGHLCMPGGSSCRLYVPLLADGLALSTHGMHVWV